MKIVTDALSQISNINFFLTEYAPIYPITPSSSIGEQYSLKAENKEKNIFNNFVKTDIMQSEAGAIASASGAINSGLYSTTFTSSQGLLLMIPNMYKIASSLKPFVLNVASRSISSHALNIFCDHSDVMSTRQAGFTMLFASDVQSSQDFTMLSHMITLKSKIPVLNIVDGFVTSHRIDSIEKLTKENMINLFPFKDFFEFKNSTLSNINPIALGTNQNPDCFFQNREAINPYYNNLNNVINECFDLFYKETGRKYSIFDYYGSKNASKIIVLLGSASSVCKECLHHLSKDYGVISVNVFNPFCKEEFLKVLPKTTKVITVLDRTKECGSAYQPLAQIIKSFQLENIKILCGIFGLGGKEFNLSHAKTVFENMDKGFKDNFTIGITDDITNSSLEIKNQEFKDNIFKFLQLGIGNDGSVSSTKSSMKILGKTENFVAGNFYYDSKKSGSITQSEMLISKEKIKHNFKASKYDFISINNLNILNKIDIVNLIKDKGAILINSSKELFNKINPNINNALIDKKIKVYLIDADKIALENNLGNKINLIMQYAFFTLTDFIDSSIALNNIKLNAKEVYNKDSDYLDCVDSNISKLVLKRREKTYDLEFIDKNTLPVSRFKANGEMEIQEKQNINSFSSIKANYDEQKCIQCLNCEFVCPHSAILIKKVYETQLKDMPEEFKYIKNKNGECFCLYIDTNKCTGCGNCAKICPTNALTLKNYTNTNKEYFESLQGKTEEKIDFKTISYAKNYYSNCTACTGCSEIAYFKLLGKLYGEQLVLSNATGCSSIYNGDMDCSPFIKDENNLGTSFISNLFEDNAEFGYGLTKGYNISRNNFLDGFQIENLSVKFKKEFQKIISNRNDYKICKDAYVNIQNLKPTNQSDNVLKECKFLMPLVHFIVGGDGWAYDIDFGGLDHVVSRNENVNILILDNEVYSNTGGQTSKSTNYGAKTKYTNLKNNHKKDLFLSLFQYENLYFSKVSLGANKNQCLNAFIDAVNHNGPSIILAYSPCINHKIKMENSVLRQKDAVKSGYFNLMTFKNQLLTLDSTPNFENLENFLKEEGRFSNLKKEDITIIQQQKEKEYKLYKNLSTILSKEKDDN